jgi:small conductance mechanosensitive channel
MAFNGAINLVAACIILAIGWMLSRWIWTWAHDGLAHLHYMDETLKPLIANLVSYAVLAVTVVAVLGQFGVQTTSLIAVLGAAGLAVGLALQGTLSNVASSVMLLMLRPFRVGEAVKVSDTSGTVREIGLFRTVMVTDDGLYVSIPNATIFSGTIVNNSREKTRRIAFPVDAGPGVDIEKARTAIIKLLTDDTLVLKNPPPSVSIDTASVTANLLSVEAWVANRDFGSQLPSLKLAIRQALKAPELQTFAMREMPGG